MKMRIMEKSIDGRKEYWVCKRVFPFIYLPMSDGGEYPRAVHHSLDDAERYMRDYKKNNYKKWID